MAIKSQEPNLLIYPKKYNGIPIEKSAWETKLALEGCPGRVGSV